MRAWHRLTCHGPHNSSNNIRGGERALTPVTPTPRAFHVSWEFDADLYVHGGEGSMGVQNIDNGGVGGCGANINAELEGLLEGVGRDPFAEEDGGVPLERGRVVVGGGGLSGHRGGARGDKGISHASQRQERDNVAVTILEDVWKLDVRTHQWERVSGTTGRRGAFRHGKKGPEVINTIQT